MGLESTSRWRTLGDHFNAQWCSAMLRVWSILVFLFREQPPRCPRSTDAALRKNWELAGHRTYVFTYVYSMRLAEETGHAGQSCSVQLTHNWAMYSISLLSAVILLKSKTIDLHDKECLQRSFEICFHSIMWGISASTPRI